MKKLALTVALAGTIIMAGAPTAQADVSDSWITTKAKIALLTSEVSWIPTSPRTS